MSEFLNGFEIDQYNVYKFPDNIRTYTCPLCSAERKKKTQKCVKVFWDTGMAYCSHCGETIQLHTYKKKNIEKKYIKPAWKNNTVLSDNVVKWFESRKISQFVLRVAKISEGQEWMPQTQKNENTIQFNYFRDEELINVKYRDARKNFKLFKDAEKIFYNLDKIRTTKECIIVEGEIDALSCIQSGMSNVVSTPNGSTTGNVNLDYLDSSIEYFENKDKIYLALDDDEPGRNVQKELVRRLGAEKCFLVDLSPCKDFNEVLVKEGEQSVRDRIDNAKECPLEDVVTIKNFSEELDDFFINGLPKGYQIGLPSFDNNFSTLTGQYIVVTGIPSHGKSEFVDMMTAGYNMKYGWKTAYCSPENEPALLHAQKLVTKFIGYTPNNRAHVNSSRYKIAKEHVSNNYFHMKMDAYDLETVLKKGAELVKRKGIKCLVLDPFNKIPLKSSNRSDINQYTSEYLNAIDIFCRKYDVLVILVAHPKKMNKVNGITPEPDFYDIKGGGEFYDMSYHGLLIHRDFEKKLVKVKVLKCKFRHLGENNSECNFAFNLKNGRYSEIRGNIDVGDFSVINDNKYWLEEKNEQIEIKEYEQIEDPLSNYDEPEEDCPF